MSRQHPLVPKTHTRFNKDKLVNNSANDILILELNTPLSLRDRFIRRLSKLLKANIQMSKSKNKQSISILLVRKSTPSQHLLDHDKELHQLLRSMEDSLSLIAVHNKGIYSSGNYKCR